MLWVKEMLGGKYEFENGILKLTDEQLQRIPLTDLRCWRFNRTGHDFLESNEEESEYMCCKSCEECTGCNGHGGKDLEAPLYKRWEKLQGIKTEVQTTLFGFSEVKQ